jgi:hypothetical protein
LLLLKGKASEPSHITAVWNWCPGMPTCCTGRTIGLQTCLARSNVHSPFDLSAEAVRSLAAPWRVAGDNVASKSVAAPTIRPKDHVE